MPTVAICYLDWGDTVARLTGRRADGECERVGDIRWVSGGVVGGECAASLGSDPSWSFQADAYGHIPRPSPRRWLRTHFSILIITPTVAPMGLWLGAYVSVISLGCLG